MLWVTWRQHRAELVLAAALLAAIAVPLVLGGIGMHEAYRADGVAACVTNSASRSACAQIVDQFVVRNLEWSNRLVFVALLPGLAGVFVGAPLFAREFERGTWKLAFTQSVTRTRWLTAKLAAVGLGVTLVAVALAALLTWWRGPLDDIDGRMRSAAFIIAAPSLGSATLFAFALGALAGVLLRRTIVAMGVTLVAFVAVRVPMEEYLRPRYQAPRLRITDPGVDASAAWRPTTDWVVESGWVDGSGRRLTDAERWSILMKIYDGEHAMYGSDTAAERYMADHGLRHFAEYHPTSAFWTFQAIESGLFLGLAAVLLAAVIAIVRRRTT
ncbi:ABC transporter permease subunit [Phytohabitans rumicis]|uniref:Transporter n=1 Tax=Phytohabitans rumicis TaxID=1076125 RepID=A0A6V8LIZ5_9ACTN|nr:ABC transporter permease subunit [Phytohabitans rumicis]GFJ94891.1 transporter [Phytohabitans rumicis]